MVALRLTKHTKAGQSRGCCRIWMFLVPMWNSIMYRCRQKWVYGSQSSSCATIVTARHHDR